MSAPATPCSACEGRRFIRVDTMPGDPAFGHAFPCPDCTPSPESSFNHILSSVDFQVTDYNRAAVERAMEMALEPKGWLLLTGKRGTGKSTLLTAIKSAWAREHTKPWTAIELLDYWRERVGEGDFDGVYAQHTKSPRFVIDDLAAPKGTEWAVERLTGLLDYRYARSMVTVLATDLNENELAEHLGPRLADRVFDHGTGLAKIVNLGGPSWRTGRKW